MQTEKQEAPIKALKLNLFNVDTETRKEIFIELNELRLELLPRFVSGKFFYSYDISGESNALEKFKKFLDDQKIYTYEIQQ